MNFSLRFKSCLLFACFAIAISQSTHAVEVGGIKFDETMKVGNKDLILNGAGMRVKAAFFKLYVAGLYLPEKKATPAEVLALPGAKRVSLVMLREVSSEDFGDAFMKGLNENADKAEKTKYVSQITMFGEVFASVSSLKKGDVLLLDWVPGVGMTSALNGKQLGATITEPGFYNVLLKIWLGDKPVDTSLKPQLLGVKAN